MRDFLMAEAHPLAQASGMTFDIRTVIVDVGIVGWLGGCGALLSLVWLLCALVAWIVRRMRAEPRLALPSRYVVAAVLAGVLLAVGTHQFFASVYGIHMM